MSEYDVSKFSLRDPEKQTHDIETYATPDPDADEWPVGWSKVGKHNWLVYGKPVFDQLNTATTKSYFKRIYRPKHTLEGLIEQDSVEIGSPEDYISEKVAARVVDDYSYNKSMHRKIASINANDDLDRIADEIVTAIEAAIDHRPSELPSPHKNIRNVDPKDVPLTGELLIPNCRLR